MDTQGTDKMSKAELASELRHLRSRHNALIEAHAELRDARDRLTEALVTVSRERDALATPTHGQDMESIFKPKP